ncbi:MAG: serpin family protein [Deltaproteobacteria bacterium]|nr:serpin family protein [Deltaproteobacteria bacterium]
MRCKSLSFLASALAALAFTACNAAPEQPQRELPEITELEQGLVESSNAFGFELFEQVDEPGENTFISPLSVSIALGMVLNGAGGETFEAVRATLNLDEQSLAECNTGYHNLTDVLQGVDPLVQMEIANSVWIQQGFEVLADFIQRLADSFYAVAETLDFADPASVDVINGWVDEKTHGKIDSILDAIPPYAVMYLINAVYFKGDWTTQFDPDETRDAPFHLADGGQASVPLMHLHSDLAHLQNEEVQAVELPYGDGLFAMTVLLPAGSSDIDALAAELDAEAWAAWHAAMHVGEAHLYLPSFELEWEASLNEALQSLGMGIAFGPGADFSGINPDAGLAITQVKHKTYVKVDEEGTEAAAVTSVEFGTTSTQQPETFTMRADRPFLFVIHERSTGALLFMGKIVDPS